MMIRATQLITILFATAFNVFSQSTTQADDYEKHYIGSDVFMLYNHAPDTLNYYRLNYGYRITPKDVVSLNYGLL